MTVASGTRVVPFPRQQVWEALSAMPPYCPVCDVSYVVSAGNGGQGLGLLGEGTRFLCVRGRVDGALPPVAGVGGRIVEWIAGQRVGTRLEPAGEIWTTRVDLADAEAGSTRVTVTVAREPNGGSRFAEALRRSAMQRMVEQTVRSELDKLPEHIRWATEGGSGPDTRPRPSPSSMSVEGGGSVLHLRGEVHGSSSDRRALELALEAEELVVIDVCDLTYLDAAALPILRRWAIDHTRAGRFPVLRGANEALDRLLADTGLASVFVRDG